MAKRLGYIELYQDASGQWRWRATGGNGRVVDIPGEAFASKSNARRSAVRQHPELAERVRDLTPQFKGRPR